MKCFPAFVLTCLLIGCQVAQPPATPMESDHANAVQDNGESPIAFLLSASAGDFQASAPGAARVRDVRLGHVPTPAGEKQHLLCGEFLPATGDETGEWTPFITIKTSGYEQWLGGQASGLCGRQAIVWATSGDLSAPLQNELDSLR